MPQIDIPYGLNVLTTDPMDGRALKANLIDRDAIPATSRHQGLTCYVISEQKYYQLIGGIANSNWKEIGFTSGLNEYLYTNDLEFGTTGLTGATAPVINDHLVNVPLGNYLGYVYVSSGTAPGTLIIRPSTSGIIPYSLRVDKCIVSILSRIQFQSVPVAGENFNLNTGISIAGAVGSDVGASIRLLWNGSQSVFLARNSNLGATETTFSIVPTINTWYDCKIVLNPNNSTVEYTLSNGVNTQTFTHTTNYPPVVIGLSPSGTYQWTPVLLNNLSNRGATFRVFLDFFAIKLTFATPRSTISV